MITLLTDFGLSEYVGVMKGVILKTNPQAKIIDLTHDVSSQSILEASWILKNNYSFFPKGTVFCCVVDPGVGSSRKALAVKTRDYFFIAPDNGLIYDSIKNQRIDSIRQLIIPKAASKTFHGRDVFALAAAKIDRGNYYEFSRPLKKIKEYKIPPNSVVRIDSFGNIITNIPKKRKKKYSVHIGKTKFSLSLVDTYEEAPKDVPFLIEGSAGTLEISIKNGSAFSLLKLKTGQIIKIL